MSGTGQLNQMEVYICNSFKRSTSTAGYKYLLLNLE